jgi:hypothetical protein
MQKWKILLYSQTFLRYDSINYLTKKWNVFHRIVFEFTPIRCRTSISKEILFWGEREMHRTTTGKEKKGCDRIKLKTCKTFLMEISKTSKKNSLGVKVKIKKFSPYLINLSGYQLLKIWLLNNRDLRQSIGQHFWQEINCSTHNYSTAQIKLSQA